MKKIIKHKALGYAKTAAEQEWYLCNQAVMPTPNKLVYRWRDVTCKNCLKQKPKGMELDLIPPLPSA